MRIIPVFVAHSAGMKVIYLLISYLWIHYTASAGKQFTKSTHVHKTLVSHYTLNRLEYSKQSFFEEKQWSWAKLLGYMLVSPHHDWYIETIACYFLSLTSLKASWQSNKWMYSQRSSRQNCSMYFTLVVATILLLQVTLMYWILYLARLSKWSFTWRISSASKV